MPFVSNRGQAIHYTAEGSGPLVLLLHGLLMDAETWTQSGIVAALIDSFRVARVDALGHGRSDKPIDPDCYTQRLLAADVIAVIDGLGYDRAHVVGYSSGGWLSAGLARYYPDRLASLVIGGWDLVGGLPKGPDGPIGFEAFMDYARITAPGLVEWVTPETSAGVRASFEALRQLQDGQQAVLEADCPVSLWSGWDDPCHDPMQTFARTNRLPFLSSTGDHLSTFFRPDIKILNGICSFLHRAQSTCRSTL